MTNPDLIRVLLVEDHSVVRTGLRLIIDNEEDMTVVGEAEDGLQAMQKAQEVQPDVIVMDMTMPGLGGLEATRQIKRHLPRTRVIALSMHNEARVTDRVREAGAAAYLLKTAPSEELLAAIRGPKAGSSR